MRQLDFHKRIDFSEKVSLSNNIGFKYETDPVCPNKEWRHPDEGLIVTGKGILKGRLYCADKFHGGDIL